jgi:predicted nucleic acid-binding protein
MIFLDTSAIYDWTDTRDPNHAIAVSRLEQILTAGEELLTHNYVLLVT